MRHAVIDVDLVCPNENKVVNRVFEVGVPFMNSNKTAIPSNQSSCNVGLHVSMGVDTFLIHW